MCLFCAIAAGEIPCDKVYEDDTVLAFRDIHPQAPTHVLVIPKEHIESFADLTADHSAVAAHCLEVLAMLKRDLGLTGGARIISNCGPDAGQSVPHLHFHLLGGKPMGEKLL